MNIKDQIPEHEHRRRLAIYDKYEPVGEDMAKKLLDDLQLLADDVDDPKSTPSDRLMTMSLAATMALVSWIAFLYAQSTDEDEVEALSESFKEAVSVTFDGATKHFKK